MAQQSTDYKSHKKIKCLSREGFTPTFIVKCASNRTLYTLTEHDDVFDMFENKVNDLINTGLLKTIDHPNFPGIKAAYQVKTNKLYVVTDYIKGISYRG